MPNEIFPNAPIAEAVFEFRFPGKLCVDSKKDLFQEAVIKELPVLQVGTGPTIGVHHNLIPYRLSNGNDTELVHFSINTFSYHSKIYRGFDDFMGRCLHFADIFGKLFSIAKIHRTGLRYINHIPVLRENNVVPLKKYLNFGYALPASIPVQLESFNTTIVTQKDSGKLYTRVDLKALGDPAQSEMVVLDFDFIKASPDLKHADLKAYLQESHGVTKKVFLDLMSEDYLKFMRMSKEEIK